jgi:hypothetical protein
MQGNIIRKALNRTYSFSKSKGDMEALRQLAKGERADSDTDFSYYAAVFNICTEFCEQMLNGIQALDPFNNLIVDAQEEYMPSGPPMSPVTLSFFSSWMALDAPIDEKTTLGSIYLRYIREKNVMLYAQEAMEHFVESYANVFQVVGGDLRRTIVWDIVNKREIATNIGIVDYAKASYEPTIGDVWYTRILPPLKGADHLWTVFGTPYVFRKTGRKDWEEFFARRAVSKADPAKDVTDYLKRGDSFTYWLEFVFQTYIGHTREVIFAEGLPDIKDSRPHGDQDGGQIS